MVLVDALLTAGHLVQVDVGTRLVAGPIFRLGVFGPEDDVGVEAALEVRLHVNRLARDDLFLVVKRLVVVDQVVVHHELVVDPPLVLPGDDVARSAGPSIAG